MIKLSIEENWSNFIFTFQNWFTKVKFYGTLANVEESRDVLFWMVLEPWVYYNEYNHSHLTVCFVNIYSLAISNINVKTQCLLFA